MGVSSVRRRGGEGNENDREDEPSNAKEAESNSEVQKQRSGGSSFSMAIVFLLFVAIWSTATFLSGSVFHICISSRKLNVYCISGSTGREIANFAKTSTTANNYSRLSDQRNISVGLEQYLHRIKNRSRSDIGDASTANHDERASGIRAVEEEMKMVRTLIPSPTIATVVNHRCEGRGIYVYDLPTKFNHDLLGHCRGLLPWEDLCSYFSNEGIGEPIPSLGAGWYRTYQYSLEPIFHNRALTHPCRTHDSDAAAAYYVPFYGGLDILRWNFNNVTNEVKDSLGKELVGWLEERPSWGRNKGKDHFFALGRISWDFRRRKGDNWGNQFLDSVQMQNPYKLLIERQPWEMNDIGIPYPTNFHPHSDDEIERWQTKIISALDPTSSGTPRKQKTLNPKPLKSELVKACNESGETDAFNCKFVDCSPDACPSPETVVNLFGESEFCLHPPGDDSPSRRSVFESMVAGCIPVLFDSFTAYYQYPWHLPEDHRLYSVYIAGEEVVGKKVDVMEKLGGVSKEQRDDMRRYIVYQLMPGLVYGDSTSRFERFRDAFGIAVDGIVDLVIGAGQNRGNENGRLAQTRNVE